MNFPIKIHSHHYRCSILRRLPSFYCWYHASIPHQHPCSTSCWQQPSLTPDGFLDCLAVIAGCYHPGLRGNGQTKQHSQALRRRDLSLLSRPERSSSSMRPLNSRTREQARQFLKTSSWGEARPRCWCSLSRLAWWPLRPGELPGCRLRQESPLSTGMPDSERSSPLIIRSRLSTAQWRLGTLLAKELIMPWGHGDFHSI